MSKKAIFFIILAIVLVLFIAFTVAWFTTDLPEQLPTPKARAARKPVAEAVAGMEGLSITIDPDSVTPTSATVTIHNDTGAALFREHQNSIEIQMLKKGQWHPIKRRTDSRAVKEVPSLPISYRAEDSPYTESVTWESFLGELTPGHYRLVWEFWTPDYAPEEIFVSDGVLLSAEFDVK